MCINCIDRLLATEKKIQKKFKNTTVTVKTIYEIHLVFGSSAIVLQAMISGQPWLYWQKD